MIHFVDTDFGFEYGAAEVTRLFSDEKTGRVVIGLKTRKEDIQIVITKTGKVRVINHGGGEWKKPNTQEVK